jgi:hypothetical protein
MVNSLPPLLPGLVRSYEMSSPLQPLDRMSPSLGQRLTQHCPLSCLSPPVVLWEPHAVHCPPSPVPAVAGHQSRHVLLLPNHHIHAGVPRQAVLVFIVPPHMMDYPPQPCDTYQQDQTQLAPNGHQVWVICILGGKPRRRWCSCRTPGSWWCW